MIEEDAPGPASAPIEVALYWTEKLRATIPARQRSAGGVFGRQMERRTYVPCERCGSLNRVALPPPGKSALCGKCKARLALHDGVVEVGESGLAALIAKSPLPVVVDFWAEWCAPCQVFAPVFLEVAGERFGRAVFAKVDTERAGEAAQAHDIQAIPTLLVFRGGRELGRKWGALPADELRLWLDSLG